METLKLKITWHKFKPISAELFVTVDEEREVVRDFKTLEELQGFMNAYHTRAMSDGVWNGESCAFPELGYHNNTASGSGTVCVYKVEM